MDALKTILITLFLFTLSNSNAQTDTLPVKSEFSGQVSAYAHFNPDNTLNFQVGARYLPQFSFEKKLSKTKLLDLEVSANVFGLTGFHPFDSAHTEGGIRPYRGWIRYSNKQFEVRVGLQKISFGAASILRPLMWFDQIDPRDPLRLTTGVWGALGRYYFLNNANIWLWTLYGNENIRGWERVGTNKRKPEFGGRFQAPMPKGEVGLSYHYRTADSRNLGIDSLAFKEIPENRLGFDGKWDIGIGLWVEGSWTHKSKNVGVLTNQTLINLGMDYTFGLGNGLNMMAEQLFIAHDEKAFAFKKPNHLSALTLSYPLSMFDNLSTILYYDYTNKEIYSFINWQKQLKNLTFYLILYSSPKGKQLIQQDISNNPFSGNGIQILFTYNH